MISLLILLRNAKVDVAMLLPNPHTHRYDEAFWKSLLEGGSKRGKEENIKELDIDFTGGFARKCSAFLNREVRKEHEFLDTDL
jgi:hypothetical protein